MKVTLTEIAQLAGVSVATVSRYFKQQHVGPATAYLKHLKGDEFGGMITSLPETPLPLARKLPTVSFDRPISREIPLVSCENYGGERLRGMMDYQL